MYDNIPVMGTIDLERAPWKDNSEYITATQSYTFSFDFRLQVPKGLEDEEKLKEIVDESYPTLEEIFKYLENHFKVPNNLIEKTIRHIARSAIIDDSSINF